MTRIKIDHDISFSEYDTKYIIDWSQKIPYPISAIYIRRSTGGNTHVCVDIPLSLSPLDELLIRAIMHDDARRIRGDLERYLLDSKIFGLLFDEKYYPLTRVLKKAGKWIKIK